MRISERRITRAGTRARSWRPRWPKQVSQKCPAVLRKKPATDQGPKQARVGLPTRACLEQHRTEEHDCVRKADLGAMGTDFIADNARLPAHLSRRIVTAPSWRSIALTRGPRTASSRCSHASSAPFAASTMAGIDPLGIWGRIASTKRVRTVCSASGSAWTNAPSLTHSGNARPRWRVATRRVLISRRRCGT